MENKPVLYLYTISQTDFKENTTQIYDLFNITGENRMDNTFLVLMLSGRTESVKAARFELVTESKSKRLLYKFYRTTDDTSARCFFASEDIIGIIPNDMLALSSCVN